MKRTGKRKRAAFTEIFLSHSSRDRKAAKHLAEMLRDHGVPVWYSETNLIGAQQWHDEIGAALSRCDWFIVLLSPNAVKSPWVKRELMYALRDLRYEGRILPVLHKPCESAGLSWTLEDFHRIDLNADFEKGSRALLRTWGIGYKPRTKRAKTGTTR